MTRQRGSAGVPDAEIDPALLGSLLANASFILLDRDLRFTRISQRFANDMGLPADTVNGHRLHDASPALAGVLESPVRIVFDKNHPVLDFKLSTATLGVRAEHPRQLHASCYPVGDPHHKGVWGALVIVSDLPERRCNHVGRRRADMTLRESRQRLNNILSALNDVVWSISATTFEVLYLNAAAETIYGRPASEFLSNPRLWLDVVHPDDQEQVAAYLSALQVRGAAEIDYRIIRPDGEVRSLHGRARLIHDPNENHPVRIHGIATDVTERKKAEEAVRETAEALKESEALFRGSFDNAAVGMALVGVEGRFLQANEALCRFLGYSQEELLNVDFQSLTYLEDLQADLSYAAELLEGRRQTYRMEKRYIHKEGHVLWGDLSVSLLQDGSGKPLYFIAQVQDATTRKEAEMALSESEHLLRRVTDDAPVYLAYCDLEHRYCFVNRGYAQRFGLLPEDIVGRHIPEVVGEKAYAAMLPHVEAVTSGVPVHFEAWMPYPHIGQRYMDVDYVPDVNEQGAVQGLVAAILDITERKLAEESLKQQKEIFQSVFDNVPVMIAMVDPNGHQQRVNQEWQRVLGWTPEEAQTRDLLFEMYPDSKHRQYVRDFILKAERRWEDFNTRTKDGSIIPTSWANVRISNGWFIGIGQDMRQRKETEEELERSREQLRALAVRLEESLEEERKRISREIHDQLGQALTGFKLDVAWLGRHLLLSKAAVEPAILQEKLASMSEVVDGVIDSVRALSWELRPPALDDLGLEAAIEWQVEEFEKRSGIKTAFITEPLEPEPDIDKATAAFRILQEALTNVARHAVATNVDIFLSIEEGNLLLEVRDNGRGMPQEPEETLTGVASALGSLGLLGMRERAIAFGGALQIRSKPGKGTTLLLRLPLI